MRLVIVQHVSPSGRTRRGGRLDTATLVAESEAERTRLGALVGVGEPLTSVGREGWLRLRTLAHAVDPAFREEQRTIRRRA
jgi:hypothetical protein